MHRKRSKNQDGRISQLEGIHTLLLSRIFILWEAWSTRVCPLRKIIKVGGARPGKSTPVPAEYHPVMGLGGYT